MHFHKMTKIIDFERAKGFNTALPFNRISMEEKLNTIHDLIYDRKSGRAGCSSKNDVTDIRKGNAWTIFSEMEQKNEEIPREKCPSNIKTIPKGGKLRKQIKQGLVFIVPFIAVFILLILLFNGGGFQ